MSVRPEEQRMGRKDPLQKSASGEQMPDGDKTLAGGRHPDDPHQEAPREVTHREAVEQVSVAESRDVQNPVEIARDVAIASVEDPSAVGDFVKRLDLGGGVYDFRFASRLPAYRSWQWAVSMFHDVPMDEWTVNECALLPTRDSLVAPAWVPFRDRLKPEDIGSTDWLGTEPDDSRLEPGMKPGVARTEGSGSQESPDSSDGTVPVEDTDADGVAYDSKDSAEDLQEVDERFHLTRRTVLTRQALQETAQRWYDGPHGPKSLSTSVSKGHHCESCAFFLPLAGSMGRLFGVCANRWSPDDGKVVSLDHGCGEHSDIEPPMQKGLWPENSPIYDDEHIDVVSPIHRSDPDHSDVVENIEDQEDVTDAPTHEPTGSAGSGDSESSEGSGPSATVRSSGAQDVRLDASSSDPYVAQEVSEGFTRRRVRTRHHRDSE